MNNNNYRLFGDDNCFDGSNSIDFYDLLDLLDTEVKRLGWTKKQYKAFVTTNYHSHSRLLLTDEQLFDLLAKLKSLKPKKIRTKKLGIGKK